MLGVRRRLLVALAVCLVAAPAADMASAAVRPADPNVVWADRVSAICHRYERKLAQVPAPATVGNVMVLSTLAGRALPLLEDEARELRKVAVPAALRARVDALLNDSAGAVLALRRIRAAARKDDLRAAQQAFVVFLAAQSSSRARAQALGIRC